MPYVGPRLHERINPRLGGFAARDIAGDAGDRWHFVTTQNTPVETGNLRTSWYLDPAIGANRRSFYGFPAYEVVVATDVDYAPYVEWDTRPHEIRPIPPNTRLHFFDRHGNEVFATRVSHPGTRGQHMMSIGAHVVETTLDEIGEPGLERFVAAVERHWGG